MSEWRSVSGWEGFYEVSDDGRVRSLARTVEMIRRGKVVRVSFGERVMRAPLCEGYPKVVLSRPGRQERKFVHQLVCTAFHGPPPPKHEVAHNDGDRSNPRADNLRWATRHENILDMAIHGTQRRGEQMSTSKLTENQARQIMQSKGSSYFLARLFGVSPTAIRDIRVGNTWRHLREEVVAC
jgi:hypothetical protein